MVQKMRTISEKQVSAVIKLPAPKRYSHFVKEVAGWEEVWGLYQDGWALATNSENEFFLPVWPAREYAELCRGTTWSDYEAKSICLYDFMERLLPDLSNEGILPCIFYLPTDKGIIPKLEILLEDLKTELDKY